LFFQGGGKCLREARGFKHCLERELSCQKRLEKKVAGVSFGFKYSRCCSARIIRTKQGMLIEICSKCKKPARKLVIK